MLDSVESKAPYDSYMASTAFLRPSQQIEYGSLTESLGLSNNSCICFKATVLFPDADMKWYRFPNFSFSFFSGSICLIESVIAKFNMCATQ